MRSALFNGSISTRYNVSFPRNHGSAIFTKFQTLLPGKSPQVGRLVIFHPGLKIRFFLLKFLCAPQIALRFLLFIHWHLEKPNPLICLFQYRQYVSATYIMLILAKSAALIYTQAHHISTLYECLPCTSTT